MEAKITSKGQMTLPKEAREHLKVKPGDKVRIFLNPNGQVAVLPVLPASALRGLLKSRRSKPVSIKEMDDAVKEAAAARYRRATGR